MAAFDLTTAQDAQVLRVSGPLAHSDCGSFRAMLEKATRGTGRGPVIVDLSGLEFICSSGMSLLVQFERALAKSDRRMVTAGLHGTVRETIEMCGVDKLLTTAPSVRNALGDRSC